MIQPNNNNFISQATFLCFPHIRRDFILCHTRPLLLSFNVLYFILFFYLSHFQHLFDAEWTSFNHSIQLHGSFRSFVTLFPFTCLVWAEWQKSHLNPDEQQPLWMLSEHSSTLVWWSCCYLTDSVVVCFPLLQWKHFVGHVQRPMITTYNQSESNRTKRGFCCNSAAQSDV